MTGIIKVDTIQNNGGTTALEIDSDGMVRQPNKCGFVAYGTASSWYTFPDGTAWHALVGGTTHTTGQSGNLNNKIAVNWSVASPMGDNNSDFNTTTGLFTCPVGGMYTFHFQSYCHKVNGSATGNYLHVNSAINGGIKSDYTIFGHQETNYYFTVDIGRSWFLNAGDTFQFSLYQSAASQIAVYPAYMEFSGYLVG